MVDAPSTMCDAIPLPGVPDDAIHKRQSPMAELRPCPCPVLSCPVRSCPDGPRARDHLSCTSAIRSPAHAFLCSSACVVCVCGVVLCSVCRGGLGSVEIQARKKSNGRSPHLRCAWRGNTQGAAEGPRCCISVREHASCCNYRRQDRQTRDLYGRGLFWSTHHATLGNHPVRRACRISKQIKPKVNAIRG